MNRLKELRRAKGLTQEEIARLLGVQKAAICKYETGRVAIPPDTLVVLCIPFPSISSCIRRRGRAPGWMRSRRAAYVGCRKHFGIRAGPRSRRPGGRLLLYGS